MKNFINFPLAEGVHSRQAHCDIPDGLYEREHGRNGFFGPASHILHTHKPTGFVFTNYRFRAAVLQPNASSHDLLLYDWHEDR